MSIDAPIITFRVTKASFGMSHGKDVSTTRIITLDAVLDDGEDVRISKTHSLRNAKWSIYLHELDIFNEHVATLDAIGMLSYWAESKYSDDFSPESCNASLAIPDVRFESLLSILQTGCLPERINISVSGLTYGWEPDGSAKEWDVKTNKSAPIINISFQVPLAAVPKPFTDELNLDNAEHIPPSAADLRLFHVSIRQLLADSSQKAHSAYRLLSFLLITVIVILLLK